MINDKLYYDYNETTCPICGGKIKHPYTGSITSEQLDEDSKTCLWVEVIDENDSTLGFRPICRYINAINKMDLDILIK